MALLRTVVISDVFINVVLCLWSEGLSVESMVVMALLHTVVISDVFI